MAATTTPKDPKTPRAVPMRAIICGVHRTGTESMQAALHMLGLHLCYHMRTAQGNAVHDGPLWVRALNAKYRKQGEFGTREDWDELLDQSQAICDLPGSLFGAELAAAYPEAKVVILNRDPEKWYESVLGSIYAFMRPKSVFDVMRMIYLRTFDEYAQAWFKFSIAMFSALPYDHGKEKDKAIAWFKAQYQEYRDNIPAERCIEYRVQDGWEPLCKHLDVPLPLVKDEATGEMVVPPFPHKNDRQEFREWGLGYRARSMKRANDNLLKQIGKVAVVGALSYGGYAIWTTRLRGRF